MMWHLSFERTNLGALSIRLAPYLAAVGSAVKLFLFVTSIYYKY